MASKFGRLAIRYSMAFLRSIERAYGDSGNPTPAQRIAWELRTFAHTWKTDPQLSLFLLSPVYSREQRLNALMQIAETVQMSELLANFLRVLFLRDRLVAIGEIALEFADLADKRANVVPVKVVTARNLSELDSQFVISEVSKVVSGSPVFEWRVDPSLFGGLIVSFEGKVMDSSLRGRLEHFEHELLEK